MSQLSEEIKEALGPQSKEKLAETEKENNIIRPYYLKLFVLFGVVYALNSFNLLDLGISILITGANLLIFSIWLFIKIMYPKIKQKELTNPGLLNRLIFIVIIGLIAIVATVSIIISL
jgi:hypothetical protein